MSKITNSSDAIKIKQVYKDTPLEVNQSSSAHCLRVTNSSDAIKIKQIYIQIKKKKKKKSSKVKSWINCVEIRGKSSTLKWWNLY